VILELKSVEKLAPIHGKQLLTYLRLMNLPLGLLINFGAGTLKEGLQRVVNRLPASSNSRLEVNRKSFTQSSPRLRVSFFLKPQVSSFSAALQTR